MNIAYFDLDETIVSADSTTLWLEWAVKKGLTDKALLEKDKELLGLYYEGKVDIKEYIELSLTPIIGLSQDKVDTLIQSFIFDEIAHRYYHHALVHLKDHRANGDKIVLISASSSHIVGPIARHLGIETSFGVSAQLQLDASSNRWVYTGKMQDYPTFREGKVKKLLSYLKEEKALGRTYEKSYAYSDSINDRFMLEFADESFVINPNEELKTLANQKGWTTYFWQ